MKSIIHTSGNRRIILIRFLVGAVFLSEGLQKFIFPDTFGTGRFIHIGFPHPAFYGGLSGSFEILCGILILAGLITRPAALIMLINISVAIIVTKIPILLGYAYGPFHLRELSSYGFWPMAHEIRTDFAMFIGTIFLILSGGGAWSIDRYLTRKLEE